MSFVQAVSNWLLGEYRVRATKQADGGLVQHVQLVNESGVYVDASAGGGGGGSGDASAANQDEQTALLTTIDADTSTLAATDFATSAKQDTGNASLASIDSQLSDVATETTLSALNTKIPASPSTDRATAAAPFSVRLSDGAAFYKATTPSDTQPVSAASLPLPTGAATESTLATLNGKVTACNTGAVTVSSSALPTGAATETTLGTLLTQSDFDTKIGSLTETAPGTDTASSGINGRLQRIAQRLTTLIGSTLTVTGTVNAAQSGTWTVQPGNTANTTAWKVDGSAVTQPVSFTSLPSSSSATFASVAGSASSVAVIASNAARKGLVIFNDSTATLKIFYGTTASSTQFTDIIYPNTNWYMAGQIYTGRIDGIWASATGNARVTEW